VETSELKEQLAAAGVEHVKARGRHEKARRDLAKLLKAAQASEDVTMTEAAKLAGVGRVKAYKMVREGR
jgi:GrpB-like predicted nucleotidyltransferase (UPF0157 family)